MEGIPVLINHIREIRDVMERYGDGNKPMWITEYGWPATRKKDSSVQRDFDNQAQWLTDSFNAMLSLNNITALFWYNFRNDRPEDSPKYDAMESNFGLVEYDWTPKSSYEAYRQFITNHPD